MRPTSVSRGLSLLCLLLLGACSGTPPTSAETVTSELHRIRIVPLVDGLVHPWGMAFLPDGRMLVTERAGRLRLIGAGHELVERPVAGLPEHIEAVGQGGLLDVALDPDYADNSLIYLSYAGRGEGGLGTEVARGRFDPEALRLENVEILFRALPKSGGGRHFGGRLVFAPDGRLFLTLGDRGQMQRAQDLGDHAGSLIRIEPDGGVPGDNPFRDRADARPEIYSYGHRNMQGAALHPDSGRLWTHEHGPRGGDEVNRIQAGANYGWPRVTHGIDYDGSIISEQTYLPGLEPPIHFWDPSIAPSGMTFYSGDAFPRWRGHLFAGALKYRLLVRLELDGNRVVHEERLLEDRIGRIRAVNQGPDGHLYLLTDAADGHLLRLEPND
ncbi:MAG: PQQ-dependent sugar dehydrogenase [Candidatus Competibacterales bacterium]|nr:PQQ-dependent sugar dehydrogenase [Candidatus Competibacterales bacterium]